MAAKIMIPSLQNYISLKLPVNSRIICMQYAAICRSKQFRNYSTESESSDDVDEIEAKRNVSRLDPFLHNKMEHVLKPPALIPDKYKFYLDSSQRTVGRQRRIFAKYGRASGVDPGLLWPSKEELAEIQEDEKEFEPGLQELWERATKEREAQQEAIENKEKKIDAALAKMPAQVQALRRKLQKRGKDAVDIRLRQKAMLSEAKDFFGYSIGPKDPRFKELREKKLEEERQAKKAEAKERRATKYKASLGQTEGS